MEVRSANTIPEPTVKTAVTTSPRMRETIDPLVFSANHINVGTDTIDIATSHARPLTHRI
jgi:hypothetical protein